MKFILFTDNLGAGGAQRQLVGLAILLKQKGYDVSVSLYHNSMFYASQLSQSNIKFEVIKYSSNPFLRIPILIRYFKKHSPDWIIAYQETPSIIACLAKIISPRINILVSERTTTQTLTFRDRIRFYLYRYANSIVPNSFSQTNFIVSHYPKLSRKTKTIINFVDFEKFRFKSRIKHSIPEIIIVASIYPTKNTKNLILAIKSLKESGQKFHVKWFGINDNNITPYIVESQALISNHSLSNYIQLLPKTKDINKEYEQADYFCLPSLFEGTPNAICEAMATGLPVLCSDVCDNRMYVRNSYNGFLFNPLDPEDIARAITQALKLSEEEYKYYGTNSREIALSLFSEIKFIDEYLSIFQNNTKD